MLVTYICADILNSTNNSTFQFEVKSEKEALALLEAEDPDGRYEILDVFVDD